MAKSSHLSGLGVALLERLILLPEGLMLSSLPDPMMRAPHWLSAGYFSM